jgi:ankyrin repeat protein
MNDRLEALRSAIVADDSAAAFSLIVNANNDVINGKPSPLITAALHGRVDVIARLLDAGADINAVNKRDETACHVAIKHRQLPALQLLVARGARLDLCDADDESPIDRALCQTDDRFLLTLLDAVPPERVSPNQLAHAAAKSVAVLKHMRSVLNICVDDDLHDWLRRTPCHIAMQSGSIAFAGALVRALAAGGCDPNALENRGWTPLHYAASNPNATEDIVQLLVDLGADIDRCNSRGNSPLFMLSASGDPQGQLVEMLLALNADVSVVNMSGETACHRAAAVGQFSAVCALLAAGADFDLPDSKGISPRQYCSSRSKQLPLPTAADIESARRRIARRQLDFVRYRALQVCIGLQPLNLDALQLCHVMLQSCGAVANCIAFHHWWKIATTVKHFSSCNNER